MIKLLIVFIGDILKQRQSTIIFSVDIKIIMRKIPEDNLTDDSVDFVGTIVGNIRKLSDNEIKTIVRMFNILGIASSNKLTMDEDEYNSAIRAFCVTLTDYILGE